MGPSRIASTRSGSPEEIKPSPPAHSDDDAAFRNANSSSPFSSPSSGGKSPFITSDSCPSDDPEDNYHSHSRRRKRRSRARSWLEFLTMGVTRRKQVVDEPLLVIDKEFGSVISAGDGLLARKSNRKISIRRRKWYNYIIFCGISGLTILAILLSLNLGLILATTLLYPLHTDPLQDPKYNFYTTHPPFTQDILPIPCHSHNDYWRSVPLFGALHAGCTSTEADVWLLPKSTKSLSSQKLYVGHNRRSLTPDRTFQKMYIQPLIRLLEITNPDNSTSTKPNGVFDSSPEQALILLVDIKTSGPATYPSLVAELEPLRERGWLTFIENGVIHPRPIIVVGTGETPFDLLTSGDPTGKKRDIFFDAPLERLWEPLPSTDTADDINEPSLPTPVLPKINTGQGMVGVTPSSNFTTQNSYYASVSFKKAVGRPWKGKITDAQLKIIRGHVRGAHRRGLTIRYWGVPSWPRGLREHVWGVLVREGVDVIGVDDLEGVRGGLW